MEKKPKKLRKVELKLVDGEYDNPLRGRVVRPRQLYEAFKDIKDLAQETMIGVYLDKDGGVRSYSVLSLGNSDSTAYDPIQILEQAILMRSKKFVIIHNHPGGNPKPSPEDLKITQDLIRKTVVMDFVLLDFIIIGDLQKPSKKNYWSLYETQYEGNRYGSWGIL